MRTSQDRPVARISDVPSPEPPTLAERGVTDEPDAYLPRDRRRALTEGRELPDRVHGAALSSTTPDAGQYSYVWKTGKTVGCFRLDLVFTDGTVQSALFKLK